MTVPTSKLLRWGALATAVASVSLLLAACGGGGGGSSPTGSTSAASGSASSGAAGTLDISATESGGLGFSKRTLTARAGTVTIRMANGSSNATEHGVAIKGNGVDKDGQVVQPGGTSTVTVRLKPGTYTFYCPVPGHEQAGMKGTLTVS